MSTPQVISRRRGPDRRTRQVASNRWRKACARVTALHARVGNQRRDGLHKLTTRLVREHDVIVVEDLYVAGMVRNRRLARAISGLGMAEFRRHIEYKSADAGVRVAVVDRWYPSSKTCSACGAVRAKLTLAERQFVYRHRRQRIPPREGSDHESTLPPRGGDSMRRFDTFRGTAQGSASSWSGWS